MADVLKVSVEEMRTAVNSFKSQQNELKTAYLTMSNAIRKVDSSYDGDASEALKSQFDAMYKNIEQTEQKMQDAIDEVTKAAEIYEEAENSISQSFSSLDTGTSPFNS